MRSGKEQDSSRSMSRQPAWNSPWAAQQVGSRSQGCCRGHQLQAAAHAEGSSFPHPWPRVLRASARALHEVLRAGGAGCRAAGGSLSVLFTVYHVLRGGLRLPPGGHRRLPAYPQRPPSWGRDTDFRAEVGVGRHPGAGGRWRRRLRRARRLSRAAERLQAVRPPPGDRGGLFLRPASPTCGTRAAAVRTAER